MIPPTLMMGNPRRGAAQFAQHGQDFCVSGAADAAPPRAWSSLWLRYLGAGIGGDDTVDVMPEQHPAEIVDFFASRSGESLDEPLRSA
jgi:hypothetical protein